MKAVVIVTLSLLLIGMASWVFLYQEPQSTTQTANAANTEPARPALTPNSAVVKAAPNAEPAAITQRRKRIEDLRTKLDNIAIQRERAEAALQQAERDVTELERYIGEIKARGEDPADYADEGLSRFEPAFHAYQNAVDELELAEAMKQAAAEELAIAEEELENMAAAADKGQ